MPRLILEFAVRAALIALGTAAVLELLRVKSAGARHAAWAGVLALMMLLPVWTAWGPRASLRVLPAITVRTAVTAPALELRAMAMDVTAATPAAPVAKARDWRVALEAIYLMVSVALLARLAIGTVRAQRLLARARVVDGHLTSGDCAAPITVGLWRPSVILPVGWQQWPESQLAAVMAHEGAHVRRRDPAVEWLALLNRAVFWFHPLAWWLERRLSALAEEACDAAVLARGCDPLDYSGYLLEMARRIERVGARVNLVGMAMPGSSLPRRIRQIVARGPVTTITPWRAAALAVACAGVSMVCAAATVDRQPAVPEPPMPPAPPMAIMLETPPAPPVPPIPAAPAVPAAIPVPAAPPAAPPAPPAPPQPPQAAAQASETKYSGHRLLVLYLDPGSMTEGDYARTLAAAQKFVREQMAAADLAAVIAWGPSGVRVADDFTADREKLANDLDKLSGNFGSGSTSAAQRLAGLETAVKMLGTLPEKKSLIYFTNGLQQGTDDSQMKALINAAVRGNVAFFAIDVRGLTAGSYRLAAGDAIAVREASEGRLSGTYTIREDGTVSIPILGDVGVAGLTAAELQALLDQRFAAILQHPSFHVDVSSVHSVK